jgi:hypothetical protein
MLYEGYIEALSRLYAGSTKTLVAGALFFFALFLAAAGASFSGWDGVTRTADAYVVSWTSWMYKAF